MTAEPPRATYRLQLHQEFTLDDAASIVPYLADLGVSHLYLSPILQAVPGSTHGYDVIDHSRVSAELGGEAAFERLTDALSAHGLGLVLDIVPNHMAVTEQNRWWWDVLRHGEASRFARWFDVDWDPPESRLHNVILLPVLRDHYGRVLEAGELSLVHDDGRFVIRYHDRAFPLDPRTLGPLVSEAAAEAGSEELAFVGTALGELPPTTVREPDQVERRQRDAEVLLSRLGQLASEPGIAAALGSAVSRLNAGVDRLDALLEEQNYRLARWRAASRDLGYRRFFDIDELIGLRVEDLGVFRETHRMVLDWVADGRVQGLRIDHPDGLRDPAGYLRRLRDAAPEAWIVVEKILEPGERLPEDWPVDGTTGYRCANLATGVLIDRGGEQAMSALWAALADAGPEWAEVALDSRQTVLTDVLGSDLNRLSELFLAVCEANRRYRDFTRHELHEALREVAARLPVYRTYVRAADRHVTDRDRGLITAAVAAAGEARSDLDPELFGFLGRILALEVDGPLAAELAMRFQQLTPAVMAKGIEDTAFYRHHRLVALNEVGGDPGRFGTDIEAFHDELLTSAEASPHAMLALSTHDTKRSADVRARLALLSQDTAWWRVAVERLLARGQAHRSGPQLPTDADAYLFVQTIVGAWPIDAERAAAYMEKAAREAKLRTSWTDPNAEYDEALDRYVRGCMTDEAFVSTVEGIVGAIEEAGQRASLSQLVLQLGAPGVPDLYQGGELWDLSLVDPDNRRPVDFPLRRDLLAEVGRSTAAFAWERRGDGMPKLWLIRHLLELRARRPGAFAAGEYQPLEVAGSTPDSVIAFAVGAEVVVAAPRLIRHPEEAGWEATSLRLPDGRWRNLDAAEHAGEARLEHLFSTFPVAVLERVG